MNFMVVAAFPAASPYRLGYRRQYPVIIEGGPPVRTVVSALAAVV